MIPSKFDIMRKRRELLEQKSRDLAMQKAMIEAEINRANFERSQWARREEQPYLKVIGY